MKNKQNQEIRNINSELHCSVMEIIFSKLPIINLWSCRLVCKQWKDLISTCKFESPISFSNFLFVHRSSNLLVVDFDPIRLESMSTVATFKFDPELSTGNRRISIVNSCNGILCVLVKETFRKGGITRGDVWILNPVTNEYLKPRISKADRNRKYRYGLGLNPKTNQYKIARSSRVLNKLGTLVEIWKTNCEWARIKFLPLFFAVCNHVYFDGGIYMVGQQENRHVIYRMDVENERIKKISFPRDYGEFCHIGEVNGCLFITTLYDRSFLHVQRMRQDYSWDVVTVFSFGSLESLDFRFMKAYEDGKFLFLFKKLDLLLFDYKSMMIRGIWMDQDSELEKMKTFHPVGSISFNSLDKILAGNC